MIKLNLGAGQTKVEGFISVDLYGEPEQRVDLFKFPYPWEDNSVDEIICNHFLEHIDGSIRPKFFNELYRILKKDGKVTIVTPHWAAERAYGDPSHRWPPITRFSYLYLNKQWREQNKIDHYSDFNCNFNWGANYSLNSSLTGRSQEYVQRASETQINVIDDLVVMLSPIHESV